MSKLTFRDDDKAYPRFIKKGHLQYFYHTKPKSVGCIGKNWCASATL